MKVIKGFSEKALTQIRWWAWSAAVLPITALAGLFFIWSLGLDDLLSIAMTVGATTMFGVAGLWWWWIIWTVSRILKKDKKVAIELQEAAKHIKELKGLFRDSLSQNDK